MKPTIAALSLVLVAAFGVSARADDEKIALDKLPGAVLKSIQAKFPGAKLEEAAKEVEDGKTTYEVEFTFKEGEYTVSVKPDGTIEEIEREVAIKDLPAAVLAALKAKYPKATLDEAEEVTAGTKVTYEVLVKRKGKKDRQVTLNPKGSILEDEEVDDDDDDKEKKDKDR
jgi:Putative beta-lactamase-inhibitor-like, PepSY-like